MPYVNLAEIREVLTHHASMAAIQMDSAASIFAYVLLAIAAWAVWWGDRQTKKNSEERREEPRDEAAASPRPREGETEEEGGESEDV